MVKINTVRELGSEIKGGSGKEICFPEKCGSELSKEAKRLRDSLRTGYFLEVLTPRPTLWSFSLC